jgi:ankyrin repeat protein
LKALLKQHPHLATARVTSDSAMTRGYFTQPTLLHFVANNPNRFKHMPPRILDSAQAILDAGAAVDAETFHENGGTTLALVASSEPAKQAGMQVPLIELLVRNGADPTKGLGASIMHRYTDAVAAMIRLGATHTLQSAAGMGDVAALRKLLAGNPSKDDLLRGLWAAAMNGQATTADLLMDAGAPLNARLPRPFEPTVLHEAAWFNHRPLVERLLSRGADPTIRDTQYTGTPAGWAHHAGNAELSALLSAAEQAWADKNASTSPAIQDAGHGSSGDSNLRDRTDDIDSQVIEAVTTGNLPALQKLLDAHPEKRDLTGGQWDKPLLHLAAWEEQPAIVDELLKRGVDVNRRCGSDNAYALHFAAERGNLPIVQRLVEAGADVHGDGSDHGMNVLGWATSLGRMNEDVADYLLARGARMTIWSAVALNREADVRRLVAAEPALLQAKMSRNEHHRSPLHHAVGKNRPAMVKLLLELGADPTATDALGLSSIGMMTDKTDPAILQLLGQTTATLGFYDLLVLGQFDRAEQLLRSGQANISRGGAEAKLFVYATTGKRWDIAQWILDHGGDVNAVATVYECPATALHFAVESAPLDRVKWLLDRGADPTIKDGKYHADAFGWADFFGREDVAAVLRSAAGK